MAELQNIRMIAATFRFSALGDGGYTLFDRQQHDEQRPIRQEIFGIF